MIVGIIEPNDVYYNEQDMTFANFKTEKITDMIEDTIEFKTIKNQSELVDFIITEICGNIKLPIHTANVSFNDDVLYQMCHINLNEESHSIIKKENIKKNGIASYLSDLKLRVYGKAVIFKLNKPDNSDIGTLVNINAQDIVDIYTSKFIHIGSILSPNKNIQECKYIFNPVDWVRPSEIEKYKYCEIEVHDRILMGFFDSTQTVLNIAATKLFGKLDIHGDCIIGSREQYKDIHDDDSTNTYLDITGDILDKIIRITELKPKTEDKSGIKIDTETLTKTDHCKTNFNRLIAQQLSKLTRSK